ncbi:ABC transporter permease [Paenibacillus aurantiacus]|uniref:ABC transporter permease n=1 Tax=Paenibacillus aurantiacus TaxID=1936118 RepID=A0ABV5L0W8_9BACL
MTSLRRVSHMMKADFLERTRRYSFLITVVLSIFIAYKFIPANGDGYATLSLNGVRGVYNSAWIGSALAILASMLLSLPAFYLVKNAVERDVQTGVGQIVATTPISRWTYLLGKMWGNFILLLSLVAVLMAMAPAMQLIRGEESTVDWAALLLPFLYSTIPTMALVSALAILFEAVPLLNRGLGNILYLILWGVMIRFSTTAGGAWQDILGISSFTNEMTNEAKSRTAHNAADHVSGISPLKGEPTMYDWGGIDWHPSMFLYRLMWIAVALLIVWLASLLFHRFDLTRSVKASKKKRRGPLAAAEMQNQPVRQERTEVKLTPYMKVSSRPRFGTTLVHELRLMLKGVHLWWYAMAVVMTVLCLLLPTDVVLKVVLPLTWLWPVLIWSAMGTNEAYFRTNLLVFTAVNPIRRQFVTLWLAGVILSVLTGIGAFIHFIVIMDWEQVAAMAVGALFIPALALALGVWSGSGKLFQVVFLLMWYIGPLNRLEDLDFIGSMAQSVSHGVYLYYLLGTVILLLAATIGRARQIRAYH